MEQVTLFPQIIGWVPWIVAGVAILFLITRFFKIIPQGEIALLERRWVGSKLQPGEVFSTNRQIGIEAGYKVPGPRFVLFPIRRIIEKTKFTDIGPDEIGIVTATAGKPPKPGNIFAPDDAGEYHNDFQNAIAFLEKGGVAGTQLRVLTPGQRMINTRVFRVKKVPKTIIPEGYVGLVTARDGEPLQPGQIVGRRIQDHNRFQRAEIFMQSGGQKGPQVDYLMPGSWNINTDVFEVQQVPMVVVADDEVGLVAALVGAPLGQDEVAAHTPDPDQHHNFQDGEMFLKLGGQRGLQDSNLPPGAYAFNTHMFEVTKDKATFIEQGNVGVVISYIGKDPAAEGRDATANGATLIGSPSTDPEDSRLDSNVRTRHLVPRGYRGIQSEVLGPGKYFLNARTVKVVVVSTTTCTMAWAAKDAKSTGSGLDPFEVSSKDAFEMKIEAECIYRIAPENAAFVISKVGEPKLLETQVIHPLVNGILRNQASGSEAIKYQQDRAAEAKSAEAELRRALADYKVEVVQLLITNISMDDDLIKSVKAKSKAGLQQQAYLAEQLAEQTRIQLESTRAQADQQKRLMEAQIGIEVAEHQKNANIKTAQGHAEAVKIKAAADAEQETLTGMAKANVLRAQGEAAGAAYQARAVAVGQDGLAAIEIIERLALNGVKIVPETLVTGGGGTSDGSGGSVTGMLALLLAKAVQTHHVPVSLPATSVGELTTRTVESPVEPKQ